MKFKKPLIDTSLITGTEHEQLERYGKVIQLAMNLYYTDLMEKAKDNDKRLEALSEELETVLGLIDAMILFAGVERNLWKLGVDEQRAIAAGRRRRVA